MGFAVDTITPTTVLSMNASRPRIGQFTCNLAQAAATYDLCTATSGPILITHFTVYVQTAGAVLTSVQIKTNQTNSVDLMTAAEGVVASLVVGKNVPLARTQPIYLHTGEKLQYVLVGATGSGVLLVTLNYAPVSSGATLV